MRWYCESGSY